MLEWASDRALANLGRNQVFAVRGDVDVPTVLLFATLTNRRGQVVASSYITAQVPDPSNPDFVLPTAHGTAREALEAVGFTGASAINPGPVAVDHLQGLVGPAVRAARALADQFSDASATAIEQRIDRWSSRVDRWEEDANALTQRGDLKLRRVTVEQERTMAESMKPHQQLVRPLLVVVPKDFANEARTGE